MSEASEILEALSPPREESSSPGYEIRHSLRGCHFARARSGAPALVIPTATFTGVAGRVTGRVSLDFRSRVEFVLGAETWEAPAAIVECSEDLLLPTFCVLGADIAGRLRVDEGRPTARAVSDALASWETLLRSTRRLTPAEELGLFGELWLIHRARNADTAVKAWRGPLGEMTDFFGNGIGIECKASTMALAHEVSHEQLDQPRGDFPVFIASLWVGIDHAVGRSVAEIVDLIDRAVTDPAEFEAKILHAGYSRADRNAYSRRFVVLQDPKLFPVSEVPRVTAWDSGVRKIHYTVELDEESAVAPSEAERILVDIFTEPATS